MACHVETASMDSERAYDSCQKWAVKCLSSIKKEWGAAKGYVGSLETRTGATVCG